MTDINKSGIRKSDIMIRSKRSMKVLYLLSLTFFLTSILLNANGQPNGPMRLTDPIHGKIMLIGRGEIPATITATFAFLAGKEDGKLVIITDKNKNRDKLTAQWADCIGDIYVFHTGTKDHAELKKGYNKMRQATAIWIASDVSEEINNIEIKNELTALLRRDGVIGSQGEAAESIATVIKDKDDFRNGFDCLPNSYITTHESEQAFTGTVSLIPGKVGWRIPAGAAVVIHSGRKISVIGYKDITLRTAANSDWPERVSTYGPPIENLPYTADLISWNRSAKARLGNLFPPKEAPVPNVRSGALLIIGGHGYPEGMWQRVIEFAGGTKAHYVCLSQSAECTGASKLRRLGCKNVAVHMTKTGVDGIGQGNDEQLLEDLKNADVVYFGGGRTYKFMDAYLNTQAHELIKNVLNRGGMVLGSSAGAQIQGDFLVRGDPRTNTNIWMEGNDQGLGFLEGVIIDAHFRERGRENLLPDLLLKHPQMLGIGIDETTAIFVQGTTAEVWGPHTVTFYNLATSESVLSEERIKPEILFNGEKYDLKNRKKVE